MIINFPESGFVRAKQIHGQTDKNNPENSIPGYIPVSRAYWWHLVKEGKAPQPIRLGKGCTVWDAEEIRQFAKDLKNEARK